MADGEKPRTSLKPFSDPDITADGARRARAPFAGLKTLWVNTGTLCNIACANCYIDSSPTNDALVYLSRAELRPFLDEARDMGAREVGFTGGEPFLNPDMGAMAGDALARGFSILILTNAMRPAMRPQAREEMTRLLDAHGDRLSIRVSIDHYTEDRHDKERGAGAFEKTMEGLQWYANRGFSLSVAGRAMWEETEDAARAGFARLFEERGLHIDAFDPSALVLFPEMDEAAPTPEITDACWNILGKSPASLMCADARMVVKRKGADAPAVLACTLIAFDDAFELGRSLAEATAAPVKLNHPHCSKFCVLGGASCSG